MYLRGGVWLIILLGMKFLTEQSKPEVLVLLRGSSWYVSMVCLDKPYYRVIKVQIKKHLEYYIQYNNINMTIQGT